MIKIKQEKDKLIIDIDGGETVDALLTQLLNTALHIMRRAVEAAVKTGDDETVKKGIYDLFNFRASALLETFAPEFELRPGLTAEAILDAQNKLMAEEVAKAEALGLLKNADEVPTLPL